MPKPKLTPSFRFKQFTIVQTRAAMKVGFDGILLGACSAIDGAADVLDVGTGTGLVALMLAQRMQLHQHFAIDAIESDEQAVLDAGLNFRASPWCDRIRLTQARFQDWALRTERRYDLVLCNPPFFSDGNVADLSRRTARHSVDLSISDLFEGTSRLLRPSGRISVIVPADQHERLISLAEANQLNPDRTLYVRPLPNKPVHRVVVEFVRCSGRNSVQELAIESFRHEYTPEYSALVKGFYLRFQ